MQVKELSKILHIASSSIINLILNDNEKQELYKQKIIFENYELDNIFCKNVIEKFNVEMNKLLSLEEILELKNPIFDLYNTSAVYFLFKDNKITYIGKALNVYVRLYTHNEYKEFDDYKIYLCDKDLILDLENKYTIKFLGDNKKNCNSTTKEWIKKLIKQEFNYIKNEEQKDLWHEEFKRQKALEPNKTNESVSSRIIKLNIEGKKYDLDLNELDKVLNTKNKI